MPRTTLSRIRKPRELTPSGAIRVSLYLRCEEWDILERIARVASPGLDPGPSDLVRLAIREAGQSKRFRDGGKISGNNPDSP